MFYRINWNPLSVRSWQTVLALSVKIGGTKSWASCNLHFYFQTNFKFIKIWFFWFLKIKFDCFLYLFLFWKGIVLVVMMMTRMRKVVKKKDRRQQMKAHQLRITSCGLSACLSPSSSSIFSIFYYQNILYHKFNSFVMLFSMFFVQTCV